MKWTVDEWNVQQSLPSLSFKGPLKCYQEIPGFFLWGDTGDTQNKARGEGYSTGTYYPYRALHSQSLSEIAGSLLVPSLQKQNGRQSFSYQAPLQWNQFPVWIQRTDTLPSFKTDLKSFLFDKAYSQSWIRGTWIIPYLCCFWLGHLKFIFHFHLLCISVHEVLYSLSHSLFFVLVYLYSPPPSCNKGVLPSHCYQVLP